MKIFSVLVLVVVLLSAGCGIPHTEIVHTDVGERQSELTSSEELLPTAETSLTTIQITTTTSTEVSTDTTPEATQTTTTQPADATTQPPAETSQTGSVATTHGTDRNETSETDYSVTRKRDVLVLMLAYPDYIDGAEMTDDKVYLVMKSGNRILYDDNKEKTFDEKIINADLQDMLEMRYPLTEINTIMNTNVDPGRIRSYSLFNEIYGQTQSSIVDKLITVDFGNERLPFNKEASAADALTAAGAGVSDLIQSQPSVAGFVFPTSGTFNYRVIAGTDRLSPHAYGIAIDLKSSSNGYWRWTSFAEGEKLINIYPHDLVRLFERNGFIWGGKWNHFDIFHFEYRPEIIIKARYFSEEIDLTKPWYQGVDSDSESVSRFIEQIDERLG